MSPTSSRKGYTLVEAIVVVALTAVVLGIALDALIETNRAASVVSDQLVALREAQTIAQTIERHLRAHMATGGATEKFQRTEVQLQCLQPETPLPQDDRLIDQPDKIANVATPAAVRIRNDIERHRVILEKTGADGRKQQSALGANADSFCSDVAFAFAQRIDKFAPVWQDSATTSPRLARIVVRVWPREAGMSSFEQARRAAQPRYAQIEYWTRMP